MNPGVAIRVPSPSLLARLLPQARRLQALLASPEAAGRIIDGAAFEPMKERPALVVGAGPSAAEILRLIAEHRLADDLFIYCVDVALPAALNAGVIPHVVTTLDPYGELLERPLERSLDIAPGSFCALLATTYSDTRIVAAWNPSLPIFLYNLLCEEVPEYQAVREMKMATRDLSSKSNVGFFSVNAAFEMGHTAVAWTGIDFGFPAGRAYLDGVVHADAGAPEGAGYIVLDRERKPVRTTFGYMATAENFVEHHEGMWRRLGSTFNLSRGILPFSYDLEPFLRFIA